MEVKALFAALLATNALDTAATHVALSRGVAEANPFVLAILDIWGIAGLAAVKLGLILILGAYLFWDRPKIWSRVYLWAVTMTYTALAVYHGWGLSSVTWNT